MIRTIFYKIVTTLMMMLGLDRCAHWRDKEGDTAKCIQYYNRNTEYYCIHTYCIIENTARLIILLTVDLLFSSLNIVPSTLAGCPDKNFKNGQNMFKTTALYFPFQGEDNIEYFLGLTPSGIIVLRNRTKVGNYFW